MLPLVGPFTLPHRYHYATFEYYESFVTNNFGHPHLVYW